MEDVWAEPQADDVTPAPALYTCTLQPDGSFEERAVWCPLGSEGEIDFMALSLDYIARVASPP
jgi:hypothetical protein